LEITRKAEICQRVVTTFLNKGMIQIHESYENSINEFGLYCWDENSGDDVVIKENERWMIYGITAIRF